LIELINVSVSRIAYYVKPSDLVEVISFFIN
jgi:hypothetical protein